MNIVEGTILKLKRERVFYSRGGLYGLPEGSNVLVLGTAQNNHEFIMYVTSEQGVGFMSHISYIADRIYDVVVE